MTKLKALIVDDERLARVNLIKLLQSYPELEIVGEADSCKSALEIIFQCKPDLVFLDIQLTGETGFDLLEKIDHSIRIVFVTAFDEYAIRAFEVNATDYLLKPVNPERLRISISRILDKENGEKRVARKLEYSDSIYLKLNNCTSKFIKISSIVFITSVGNYSKIFILDGTHCLVLKTLKQWQQELPNNIFVMIHRSNIINIECIDRVEKYSNTHHKVFLKHTKEPLEISRRFAGKLKLINYCCFPTT